MRWYTKFDTELKFKIFRLKLFRILGGTHSEFMEELKYKSVTLESIYPYAGVKSPSCKIPFGTDLFRVTGQRNYTTTYGNEEDLKYFVAKYGPVASAMDSSYIQNYEGGIYYDSRCTDDVNHAVVVVG